MNDRVPNYHEVEENECQIPTSSRFNKGDGEADMMEELMWQNGQIVVQRPSKKIPYGELAMRENQQNVFMQEDEMTSWLQYSLDDFYADLLYSAPPPAPTIAPPPPLEYQEITPHVQNFAHFSRIIPGRASKLREISTTVVESNETPTVRAVEDSVAPVNKGDEYRKRKVSTDITTEDIESRSEETEFEAAEAKKQTRGSSSSNNKRSRAAEVHNLSERRRRDRINEKMKTLQELIPRCNKSDKASMLDEAIDYLKSLQMQVQMMSMGCGMIPMMYPGMQQYVPTMGPMGMGMGMGMGMNRSMVPYPSMLPGSSIPNPAAAAPMVPTFPPMPGFQLQQVPVPDPTRAQAPNQTDHVMNTLVAHSANQPQMRNFADPYQQFLGLHSAQIPLSQNQTMVQPSAGKPSTSKDIGNAENQQTG